MAAQNGDVEQTTPLLHLAVDRLEVIRREKLPQDVYDKAVLCLLDYLGALVSGLSAPWGASLLRYTQSSGSGRAEAWAIGVDSPISAESAAFHNAAIGHSMIRDDMHVGANSHIGVMVIPAALALAQREGWSGDQLLKSIVGGYDMAVALGTAVRQAGLCNPHFRPSGIIGAFGSAAAGIVAEGDTSKNTAMSALSFGVNMAAGLNEWAWVGGMEIYTQMGTASRSGIIGLGLARAGLHSSESVLEGRDGVFMAYRNGNNRFGAAKFAEWLTKSSIGAGILDAKFKPVAGCNFIQTPLSIALKLNEQVAGSLEKIERICISTTSAAKKYPGCDSLGPFTKVGQAKMSIQYGVAAALLFGRIDESMYQQHDSAALQALIQKCTVVAKSSFDESFAQGKQPSAIEITMEDGSKYQHELSDVPWLGSDAVRQRFKQEAAVIYSTEAVEQIMEECHGLQDAENCSQLFNLLAAASYADL